jgi:ParB-like chromosome segregation protein Spo0J
VTATPPTAAGPRGIDAQPLSGLRWIHRDRLTANAWNPNHAAPPERRLLALSMIENGWTQPIVAYRQDQDETGPLFEIADGYHRWLTSAEPEVYAMTDGVVPVVVLHVDDPILARLATVRHNRARGTHKVLGMADLVAELLEMGLSEREVGRRLEMDEEEVDRLADRGNMLKRGAAPEFNTGWTV